VKEALLWTRRIPRGVFLAIAGWLILSVPFFLVFEGSARAALLKHDPSDLFFRTFVRLAAKSLGVGAVFLALALLLGRASPIGLATALTANAGLLLWIWKEGADGKDLVIIVPLFVSFGCLVFEGYKSIVGLNRRTT
jgi:hypothetical protein